MTSVADRWSAIQSPIYTRMGVRTIINGRGATTAVGGTLMPPQVLAAMAEAAQAFVVIDELNAAVGEKIAAITGADAGYVTSGSAAGMALAAAACIAGTDPERIQRLPESDGWANEIIIHRAHRINYDQMFRVSGARLVEIGYPAGTAAWELERALADRTAAVAWIDSRNTGTGALPFPTEVDLAHARGIPVIVDAASTLPPVDHLRRWIRWGADLVIYSGGKGLRGPQDSGLLAGRRDLIAAAKANGSPHAGVGRGMKVSKEAMAGLWAAIDLFLETDHEVEYRQHAAEAEALVAGLASRSDVRCEIEADWDAWPAPIVRLFPIDESWTPDAVSSALMVGNPAISVFSEHGGLMISTHCLLPGDADIIVERLSNVLDDGEFAKA
jgi:L-seryl-tRNA(Ser) seleniumtransferase